MGQVDIFGGAAAAVLVGAKKRAMVGAALAEDAIVRIWRRRSTLRQVRYIGDEGDTRRGIASTRVALLHRVVVDEYAPLPSPPQRRTRLARADSASRRAGD